MDANQVAQSVLDAIQMHRWKYAAALLVIAAVSAIRKFAPEIHGRLGKWLNGKRGGAILAVLGGVGVSLLATLKAGAPLTLNMLENGIMTGVLASGGWNVLWNLRTKSEPYVAPTTSVASTEPPAPPAPPSIPPAAALILLSFFALSSGSCALAKSTIKTAGIDLGQCVLDNLPGAVVSVLPAVEQIVQNGGSDAQINQQLEVLGEAKGINTIICAVQRVIKDLFGKTARDTPEAKLVDTRTLRIHTLEKWLGTKNAPPVKASRKKGKSCNEPDVGSGTWPAYSGQTILL